MPSGGVPPCQINNPRPLARRMTPRQGEVARAKITAAYQVKHTERQAARLAEVMSRTCEGRVAAARRWAEARAAFRAVGRCPSQPALGAAAAANAEGLGGRRAARRPPRPRSPSRRSPSPSPSPSP